MAQIAHGGIAGLFGSSNDVFAGSYYINGDGVLVDSSGNQIGTGVFDEDIVAVHRSLDAIILPDGWTSWIPDPVNNEWDSYSISSDPIVGTATMVDGSEADLPSTDILQDDYDHDTVHYTFDPTSEAWTSLAGGETLTVTFTVYAEEYNIFGNVSDSDTFEITLTFTKICFVKGTLIETEYGEMSVERIRAGMKIWTKDSGLQPVRWIGFSELGGAGRNIPERFLPIRIQVGALGDGIPTRDLMVSPQHRVLVRSKIAQRMFDTSEVLVAAKQLLQLEGVDVVQDCASVEYYHVMLDQHEIVLSNGAETESLYLGSEALKGLGRAALEEITEIFPELQDQINNKKPARVLVPGRMGRQLAERHHKNGRPLIQ